jgi:uncharacterized membrane protein
MRTPASISGHPIHPMLVTLPIGLWIFSLVCDLFYVFGTGAPVWNTVALYTLTGGILGALAAAVPGFIDMLSLTGETKKTALIHMGINLTVVGLYAVNFWLRVTTPESLKGPIWLSAVSVGLLAISGWLGGHMVFRREVGVSKADEQPARRW